MIAEWGIFNDGGMLRGDLYSQEQADAVLAGYQALDDDETLEAHELCPEHECQPKHGCEDCADEY